jgi:hypothetical protein
MIPLWKGKNPIYFGVIRSKVKVTVAINKKELTTGSFPHDNSSSVYWIFTNLGHMIPLWKGKNPIYFGVITIIPFNNLYRRAYFVMHTFLVPLSYNLGSPYLVHTLMREDTCTCLCMSPYLNFIFIVLWFILFIETIFIQVIWRGWWDNSSVSSLLYSKVHLDVGLNKVVSNVGITWF